ncbi:hypothetical protein TIFTF001_055775 [Ficus carica]|uniref:Secreted protein n=1 Tax=Ficus carica TaxID=3494 RepID=A0AA88EFW7_FICCA|nr:hypothetical protein TIFTF001_055771 [Ficus carica]GMN74168.1 hypothetical protein TIFTF001_055773 [Ficus carica]GMN74177.1 hypothetical protein TIFTF001_055775 [Ficus carica]
MLLLLFSLMRWIPFAANGLKAMRVKHLDVSKQNFLYRCRSDDQKVLILGPRVLLMLLISQRRNQVEKEACPKW